MGLMTGKLGTSLLVGALIACLLAGASLTAADATSDVLAPVDRPPYVDEGEPQATGPDDATTVNHGGDVLGENGPPDVDQGGIGQTTGATNTGCRDYEEYMVRRPVYCPGPEYCRSMRIYRSVVLGRLWAQGDALIWTPKGVRLPAMVSGSTLDDPGDTSVLFGDRSVFQEMSGGGRITAGWWWSPAQCAGIQASYFEVDGHDREFHAAGDDETILGRPFVDVRDGLPNSALVAYPGVLAGAVDVWADTELSGAECLWRRMIASGPGFRLDVVAGYRYGRLFDRLKTEEHMVSLDPASGWTEGTEIWRQDWFRTVNNFHGGELGLLARWQRGCWFLDVTGKVALGGTTTTTTIDGATTTLETVGEEQVLTYYDGGVLALPTNMGRFRQSHFTVLSELEVSLRRELACNLWFRVGYNLFGWNHVGRAADQVDVGVNPTQIPPGTRVGEARPAFSPRSSSFWAQGVSLGLEYQF